MAVTNSVELALLAANPSNPINPSQFKAKLRYQQATVVAAAQAVNDTINLFKIPIGGRVVAMFTIGTASLTTSEFRIGDSSSDAKFRAQGPHVTTAFNLIAIPGTATTLAGYGTPYTADTTIFATVNVVFISGPTIIFGCIYTVE